MTKNNILFIVFICSLSFSAFSQDLNFPDSLNGRWRFDINVDGFGEMSFLLDIEKTSDSTFFASSRKKAMKEIVGWSKQFLANLFTKQLKKGTFVHVFSGIIKKDSLRGVFTAPGMGFYFNGKIENGKITGTLGDDKFGNNEKINYHFNAVPHSSNRIDYDYISLVSKIKETFQQNIFDPEILNEKEWKKFFNKLDKIADVAHDDFEFFVGFTNLSQKIKMSHIGILKSNPWEKIEDVELNPLVQTKILDTTTAYIKFDGFSLNDTLIVKNFFDSIIKKDISNLVIDMRGCSGGDYSSMLLASFLIKEPLEAGFFIGNKYFKEKRELPTAEIIVNTPVYQGNSLKEFLEEIINNGLLAGRVFPDEELHYTGKVIALIDGNSASATEPIAYFLKQYDLAILVGETTAGKMLSSTFIELQDSWNLLVPTADYYTSDCYRIEKKGVKPDIKIKSDKALDYVIREMIKKDN